MTTGCDRYAAHDRIARSGVALPGRSQRVGHARRSHPGARSRRGGVQWRGELLGSGASPATVAKAYRLLKTIMSTAVDDGIVQRNPCRVMGGGQDRSPERPVLSVGEVVALVEVMPERYRALVLLAAFGTLRWGELAALRRCDVDITRGTIRVERSLTELAGGGYLFGPPKSAAGRRVVVVPAVIKPALAHHVATFTASLPDSLVFTSPTGALLRDGNFRRRVWRPALTKAGLPGIHFHDLRHTGNTLTATAGASLRELMYPWAIAAHAPH
jgi:integrase